NLMMARQNGPSALRGLAWVLKDQGKLDEAEAFAREAMQVLPEPDRKDDADTLIVLGAILTAAGKAAGKAADAESRLREGLKIRREVLPKGHWALAQAESLWGGCLAALQRYAEAEPLLLNSYAALQKDETVPPRQLREAHERLVKLYEAWDKLDKAQEW